jgi:hypothetical protein
VRFRDTLYLLEVEGITKNRKRSHEQLQFLELWSIPIVKNVDEALLVLGGLQPARCRRR